MDIDRILRDYRYAGEDKRIILFLAYCDLRKEFGAMKQDTGVLEFREKAVDDAMKMSSISMAVFAVYLFCLGSIFLFIPNPVLALFGLPPANEVWIRILGYILACLAFYYLMAVRENSISFYRWSVYGRLPILPTFAALVLAGIGPKIILLFGTFDSGCAIWTWYALKNERA